jgi:uncharacterized protein
VERRSPNLHQRASPPLRQPVRHSNATWDRRAGTLTTFSLIIGVVWGLWHLPLFFLASSAQAHMPIPLFMLNILAGPVVFGWLFERTQGSVLPALVLHTSLNSWAGLLVIVPTATSVGSYASVTALLVLIALVLLLTPDRKLGALP